MRQLDFFILFGWLAFWLYWLLSAFGAKRNTISRTNASAGIRLGIFILVIIFIRLADRQGNSYNPNHEISHSDLLLGIGSVLFVAGLLLAVWARVYLGKNWGMPMSLKEDPELVTDGPYRFIRHPIYTGILAASIGTALATNFYWIIVSLFMGGYFIYSAYVEERIMAKEFPKVYPAYKSRTKMLIPFIF